MKYVPKAPAPDNVNVGKEHPLVEAGTLVVGLALALVVMIVALFLLVDVVLYFVPADSEARLFDGWVPGDLVTVSEDDPRLERVAGLTTQLAALWPDASYQFRVEIDVNATPNALAFPGGLIIVTTGLLDRIESENELAFVLGHEIGHFRNRDHIRSLGRGAMLSLLFTALSQGNGGAMLGSTVAGVTLNSFGRRQESAADDFGLGLVQKRYGHVADAWGFFADLDSGTNEHDRIAGYLGTHPSPYNRIERMHVIAAENGWPVDGEVTPIEW